MPGPAGFGIGPDRPGELCRGDGADEAILERLVEGRLADPVACGDGRGNAGGARLAGRGGDPGDARNCFEAMAGPSGFMPFGSNDHGSLPRLAGRRRKAVRYVVGNPLFALGAALYAPTAC